MTGDALPAGIEPGQLTATLRAAGVLTRGRVTSVQSVRAFPTIVSRLHRLKLEYEGAAAGAPLSLYLKTGLPGGLGAALGSGRGEVAFYTTVAPATPPGLLPRCFDAQVSADGAAWHLLLEDLTDTHVVATWLLPPTVAETEIIMRCRARFQAAWWDHPRLGDGVGHRPSDREVDKWLTWITGSYKDFADALGDRLPPQRRALYEKLFEEAPRLVQRLRAWRHVTIIQGDAHVWNCFLPKSGTAETPRACSTGTAGGSRSAPTILPT
jgi:hypothetical protein